MDIFILNQQKTVPEIYLPKGSKEDHLLSELPAFHIAIVRMRVLWLIILCLFEAGSLYVAVFELVTTLSDPLRFLGANHHAYITGSIFTYHQILHQEKMNGICLMSFIFFLREYLLMLDIISYNWGHK